MCPHSSASNYFHSQADWDQLSTLCCFSFGISPEGCLTLAIVQLLLTANCTGQSGSINDNS